MKLQKRIDRGERAPVGYGLAWYDAIMDQGVCYPIPLNWFMCFSRRALRFLCVPPWSRRVSKEVRYWRGKYAESQKQLLIARTNLGVSADVIARMRKEQGDAD